MKATLTVTTKTNTSRTVITKVNLNHPPAQSIETPKSIPSKRRSGNCFRCLALGRQSRKYSTPEVAHVWPIFTQVEVLIFLPVHGGNSVRPFQVSGFRIPITMEAGECGTGLTNALFAKDHLLAHEKGKLTPQPHLASPLHTDPCG